MKKLPFAIALAFVTEAAAGQTPPVTLNGPWKDASLGRAVSVLGDVDGDGSIEVLVGAPSPYITGGGTAEVVTVLTRLVRSRVFLGISGDLYGHAVAALGDIDGDQRPDFVVGAPGSYPLSGRVQVRSGANGAFLYEVLAPGIATGFGAAVAAAGDVDQDGRTDFLVGTPGDATVTVAAGRADLLSGATGAVLRTWTGSAPYDTFGLAVAGLGDVDGDAIPDVAIAAPQAGSWVPPLSAFGSGIGYVNLYSGATGALLRSLGSGVAGDGFGTAIAGCGDLDGDGHGDVLVGNAGAASAWSGATGALLHHFVGSPFEWFGHAVAGAGDVDRDGVPDLVVGAPIAAGGGLPGAGRAVVLSGKTGVLLHELTGSGPGDAFGFAVAGGADIDGDGWPDVLAGAPGDDNVDLDSGSVRVFFGHHAPSADVREIGPAWAPVPAPPPTLALSGPPVLGFPFVITVAHGGTGAPGLVAVSRGPGVYDFVTGFGMIYVDLDPAAAPEFFPILGDAAGTWSATAAVPDDPGLAGRAFVVQAASFPAGMAPRASNGLLATLGY